MLNKKLEQTEGQWREMYRLPVAQRFSRVSIQDARPETDSHELVRKALENGGDSAKTQFAFNAMLILAETPI
jgi:hypothetical protein